MWGGVGWLSHWLDKPKGSSGDRSAEIVELAALQDKIQLNHQDFKLYIWLLSNSNSEVSFFPCLFHSTALGATHAVHNSHQYQSPRTAYL